MLNQKRKISQSSYIKKLEIEEQHKLKTSTRKKIARIAEISEIENRKLIKINKSLERPKKIEKTNYELYNNETVYYYRLCSH